MANNFTWSTSIGRWMGVPVRIHMVMFLLVAIMFGLEWNFTSNNANFFRGTAMVTTLVLFASVLLHELAHIFALHNLGGSVGTIVFTPWGGNSEMDLPGHAPSRALVHLSGVFANLAVFAIGAMLLLNSPQALLIGRDSLFDFVNPFAPHRMDPADWKHSFTLIVTWVNFQLAIVNLIPCFPFDGANVVRSWITAMNLDFPRYRIETAIKVIGNAAAFGFIGLAYFIADIQAGPIRPTWMPVLMFGITLLFTARHSLHLQTQETIEPWEEDEHLDYSTTDHNTHDSFFDFSESSENPAYSQWLQEKQEARREVEIQREEEEDRRADDILKKLHQGGISSLNEEERLILDRVSARIRRRRQQGV